MREPDPSERCHPSACPSHCKHSLVLTLFSWSCGEGLGKKEQLINAPENKPRRTTSHLAPGAMETLVMSLAPLLRGVWHSAGPIPSPFQSQRVLVGRARRSLCPVGGTAQPPPPKPPQEPQARAGAVGNGVLRPSGPLQSCSCFSCSCEPGDGDGFQEQSH